MIANLPPALVSTLVQRTQNSSELEKKEISLRFKNTPIPQAFAALFKSVGMNNYRVESSLTGTVTLAIEVVGFESAFRFLLANTGTTFTKEDNIWVVKPIPNRPRTSEPSSALPNYGWQTITLKHRTAKELAPLLGGIIAPGEPLPTTHTQRTLMQAGEGPNASRTPSPQTFRTPISPLVPLGIENIVSVGQGTLLVQGDPADIEELTALIQKLDVALPSVECRAELVSVSGGKQNRNTLLTSIGTGRAGTEIKAVSKFSGTPAQTAKLDVTIKATPLADSYFEVETRWEASVPLQGAQKGQRARLEKTFSNTRRLKVGETMMFGGVIVKEEQGAVKGGQEVLFFLTLKPL